MDNGRATKGDSLKKDWIKPFLASLRRDGNIWFAAKASGINRSTAYKEKKKNKVFAKKWDFALEDATDRLRKEAFRRAYHGTKKPVYQGKQLVGHIQEYSDVLLMFLLKKLDPTYRESHKDSDRPDDGIKEIRVKISTAPEPESPKNE